MEPTGEVIATSPAARRTFGHALVNTLVASVVNYTVWFAVTFFVYLETRSVFATGIIGGIFLAFTALSGIWFGSLVDHHHKRTVMLGSSAGSLAMYAASLAVYLLAGPAAFRDPTSPVLWVFVLLLMTGVIVGNIRGIAMSTVVTLLVPEPGRDRANGLVGTASGVSFLVTSVISGLLIGLAGMISVLVLAVTAMVAVILHLVRLHLPEERPVSTGAGSGKVDLRGTFTLVAATPGLLALIVFSTINNFLGGVYMALMDPYGLSLVPVETWGLLWGFLSTGFIIGGLVISKRGLGRNPLRSLLVANVVIWAISSVFTVQSSIILLTVGMFIYLCVMPFIEASEQTVLQKVVPFERQGRVFGFAQSVEQAASPLTAFLISPIAQFVFIPLMSDGGAGAAAIGPWFGVGPERGIALVFTVTGLIGLVLTLAAFGTRYYRDLSARYLAGEPSGPVAQPSPSG